MNISDLNDKLYGHRDLKQGEYVNFIMDSINQKEIQKGDFSDISSKFNEINKEIKF